MKLTEAQIGEIAILAMENCNEWRVERSYQWSVEVGHLYPYTEYYSISMHVFNSNRSLSYIRLCVGKCVEDSPEGHVLYLQAHALTKRLNAGDVSVLRDTVFVTMTWETET